MTCIVGITDGTTVWLGGDSAGVTGTALMIRADSKVFASGEYVIAFTTSFRMGQLLRYAFTPPPPAPGTDLHEFMCTTFVDRLRACLKEGGWAAKDDGREEGGNFLVGVRGRLFEIMSDYQVAERDADFTATGCGEPFALGSLHATAGLGLAPPLRLRTALEAAARFSSAVAGPFTVVSTSGPAAAPAALRPPSCDRNPVTVAILRPAVCRVGIPVAGTAH